MSITRKSRNLLLAMAIGDGKINKNGCLHICHGEREIKYLEWKQSLLPSLFSKISFFDNNGHPVYRIHTKSMKFLKMIRPYLYKNEKVTSKILPRIGILGLAIWYMDRGSLIKKKRAGKVHAHELVISTDFHLENKVQEVIAWFEQTLDIHFSVKRKQGKFSIRCGTHEARKFIKLVKPYVEQVECFDYKIDINLESDLR